MKQNARPIDFQLQYEKTENTDDENTEDFKEKSKNTVSKKYTFDDEKQSTLYDSKIGKFFKIVGKEIKESMERNYQETENAYLDGMNMPETLLIRKFKSAKGNKRRGYVKAMESKNLLERNEEGLLIPTQQYRFYE